VNGASSVAASDSPSPLAGKRVLVTRERPGELGRLLTERGAEVVHVPLIAAVEPADGGRALRTELDRLARYDWLAVTSAAGSERVGAAARSVPSLRLAAVGTTTARVLAELAGRPVDVTPGRQLASELATAIDAASEGGMRILVAQADRAAGTLAEDLTAAGHDVTTVTAYATVLVPPERDAVGAADALALASGSAAQSWVDALGTHAPAVVVAIGPTTADIATELGLKVDGVAADHSLVGLVGELERQFMRGVTGDITSEAT
jgi:uroporphyrinogen-III synthase